MSALPPKADIDYHGRNVRFVPKADVSNRSKAGSYSITLSVVAINLSGMVNCSKSREEISMFRKLVVGALGAMAVLFSTTAFAQGFATNEMGFRSQFALRQSEAAHVRFGSKADIASRPLHVRFTPESGHWNPAVKRTYLSAVIRSTIVMFAPCNGRHSVFSACPSRIVRKTQ